MTFSLPSSSQFTASTTESSLPFTKKNPGSSLITLQQAAAQELEKIAASVPFVKEVFTKIEDIQKDIEVDIETCTEEEPPLFCLEPTTLIPIQLNRKLRHIELQKIGPVIVDFARTLAKEKIQRQVLEQEIKSLKEQIKKNQTELSLNENTRISLADAKAMESQESPFKQKKKKFQKDIFKEHTKIEAIIKKSNETTKAAKLSLSKVRAFTKNLLSNSSHQPLGRPKNNKNFMLEIISQSPEKTSCHKGPSSPLSPYVTRSQTRK